MTAQKDLSMFLSLRVVFVELVWLFLFIYVYAGKKCFLNTRSSVQEKNRIKKKTEVMLSN